ncbi:MAG TPA: hypothetical protein VNT51_11320, partial [Miltoncostaeaceae bacterium]|nr:hypothetical protein [Miltoncostaeaceae bacterium]
MVLPPEAAVARPLALLAAMPPQGPPVASWSRVSRTALVLGRAARDPPLDDAALAARGIPVLRRRSGGGPVLWDPPLLSLDVAVPPGHRLAGRDLALSYAWLGEAVAEALRALGLPAAAVPVPAARAAAASRDAVSLRAARTCFGGLSPFEVCVDGRKVVGLSQVRRRTGVLFQCGIALRLDAPLLAELLEPDPGERARLAAAVGTRAAGLDETAAVGAGEVVRAVEAALARREGVRLR